MQGEQLLQNPDFAKTLAKSPFKPQDLPKISSSVADAFQKMPAELRANMKQLLQSLDALPLEQLQSMAKVLDEIDKNKDKYAEIVARLVKEGTVGPNDFPPQYNATLMAAVKAMVGQALLKKTQNAQAPGYAKGGIASLKDAASKVRAAGRSGDTMLAHINPREAEMLRKAGGSGSINPKTGLPEFKSIWGDLLKIGGQLVATAAVSYFVGPAAAGAIVGGVSSLLSGGKPADALKSAIIGGVMGGVMGGISNVSAGGGFFEGATMGGSLTGSSPYETWLSKGLAGTSVGNTLFPGNPAEAANTAQAEELAGTVKPSGVSDTEVKPVSEGGPNPGPQVRPTTFPSASDSSYGNLAKWASDNKLPLIGLAGAGILAADAMNRDSSPTPTTLNRSVTGMNLLEQNPDKYGFNKAQFMGEGASKDLKPVITGTDYVRTEPATSKPPAFYDYSQVQYPNLFSRYQQPQFAKSGILNARVGGPINGPGTGTSDSIPARLSDGEFVMTAKAVRGAGDGDRKAGARHMYDLMHKFERRA
jgi:hypothetical protein